MGVTQVRDVFCKRACVSNSVMSIKQNA